MTVEVTQADRDAAADFADAEARLWNMGGSSAQSHPMRQGKRDDTLTVQAFARHRLAHTVDATDGEREAVLAMLNDWCTDWTGEQMTDGTTTRSEVSCGDVRRVIAALSRQPAAEADEVGRLRTAVGAALSEIDALGKALNLLGMSVASDGVERDIAAPLRTALNRADNAEG